MELHSWYLVFCQSGDHQECSLLLRIGFYFKMARCLRIFRIHGELQSTTIAKWILDPSCAGDTRERKIGEPLSSVDIKTRGVNPAA